MIMELGLKLSVTVNVINITFSLYFDNLEKFMVDTCVTVC